MRIAVLDDWAGVALDMADWDSLGAEITVFRESVTDEAVLAERLVPFDVVCLMRERTPMPASLLRRLPKLELLVTTGPRNLTIDLEAARAAGVTVCGTESRKTSTAELAMALLIVLARGIVPEAASVHRGGWQVGIGRDLEGLILGVLGLGRVGTRMAELARAFGMEVIAWSRNLTESHCAEVGVGYRPDLQTLMAESDAVSIHLVLSDRSRGLVDRHAFGAMKADGMLVNTSRGLIVDTQALLAALRSEPRRRAALDVFDAEPLPAAHPLRDPALLDSGQLLLTPHLGYVTESTWRLFYTQTVAAIAAWRAGTPVRVLTG